MTSLTKTIAEKKEDRVAFYNRIIFKMFFPSVSFQHLKKTEEFLLGEVFTTPAYRMTAENYIFLSYNIAN